MTDRGTVAHPTLSHSAKGSSVSQMIWGGGGQEGADGEGCGLESRCRGCTRAPDDMRGSSRRRRPTVEDQQARMVCCLALALKLGSSP